ncbi:acetyltransferase [Lithospermum erythrorhizon]|uniref:Acetyltransferase n=1 Tax=Lithospermum erythrorhizon TaxID=34254 RepID=A0AAV3RMM9_LITER
MAVKIDSSKIIKPFYEETNNPPSTKDYLPLTVFDIVNYNTQVAVLFAYRPPTPPNEELELGLGKALSIYRPWAGRLGEDEKGEQIIRLNDEGVKFNVASVEASLDETVSFEPSPSLRNFHAPTQGAEELVQVQLTRFSCGSLIVGFVAHHFIGDGQATSNFLVAWGRATRGVAIHPMPFLDRSIFTPREPPLFDQFEHRGVEYMKKKAKIHSSIKSSISGNQDEIEVFKVRYTRDFLAKIKAEASSQKLKVDGDNRPYSTFESLLAHAWRTITKARGLDEDEKTHVRISVNGRMRLTPNVPNYFGNLVLWAFPTSKSKDLIEEPLAHAAKVIHESVAKINDDYFKSFIDFASFKVKEEELVPTADVTKPVLCPNVNVDSWLRFEFCDLDFGTGCPFAFVPSYIPVDGLIFLLPTSREDESVDVIVSLFKDKLEEFKKICYCLE